MQKTKALFLDRDGVICEPVYSLSYGGYLTSVGQFKLVPGIQDLINSAKQKGYLVIVVTNQPQIGKGIITESKLREIHEKMEDLLGHTIDKIYYCPHTDADNCECRKPKPGMMRKAIKDFNIDPAHSFIVGDREKDILAGQKISCKTILFKNGSHENVQDTCNPDYIFGNHFQIIDLI